nr:tripartite tricarboxylate transporter substrate binding protein [Providencia huaxiensis]
MKNSIKTIMLASSLIMLTPLTATADESYPSQMIKLVVPFPPGGPTDGLARRLAQEVGTELNTQVIVENRGGAGGNIGSEYVANSKPDGYTILFGTSGPLAINTSLYKRLKYHPETSFEPIIKIGHLPNILVVHPSIEAKNIQELIAFDKKNPQTLIYASSGNGASSHLAGVMFNNMADTAINHIPYRGTGPALNDLLGGHVSMAFTDILTALPHIAEGNLKPLGLATAQRSQALPDLETIQEQGIEGYDVSVFFGIVAPQKTSDKIIEKLNNAFVVAMSKPEIKEALSSQGIVEADLKTPEELRVFIKDEVTKWNQVITEANIQLD